MAIASGSVAVAYKGSSGDTATPQFWNREVVQAAESIANYVRRHGTLSKPVSVDNVRAANGFSWGGTYAAMLELGITGAAGSETGPVRSKYSNGMGCLYWSDPESIIADYIRLKATPEKPVSESEVYSNAIQHGINLGQTSKALSSLQRGYELASEKGSVRVVTEVEETGKGPRRHRSFWWEPIVDSL
jgi:hypothetical protein